VEFLFNCCFSFICIF